MGVNTKYKDSVFSFLFSDPDILRELYCALEGVSLPKNIPVNINTLQDVLFKDKVNDISFEIGGKLVVLIEHQSTINPNIALRLLMYVARVYEKILGDKNIYSSRLIRIPLPEFFVLYNGVSPYPDEAILRLSDVFDSVEALGISLQDSPALELVVKVININHGKNEGIVKKCETLAGYSYFIDKVREFEKESDELKEAVEKAIKYCRAHDKLKEFLEKNATEVMNMLITEWNWDDALAVRYEEGLEKGLEKGMEKGMEKGLEKGMEKGLEKGMEKGLEKGMEKRNMEIAKNLLREGIPIELIQKTTGLDMEIIKSLK